MITDDELAAFRARLRARFARQPAPDPARVRRIAAIIAAARLREARDRARDRDGRER